MRQLSSADGLITVVAEAGSDVRLTVRPRDRFENSIGSDDFVFELDMRLSSVGWNQDSPTESPDAWTFTAPAYDLLVSTGWASVYQVGYATRPRSALPSTGRWSARPGRWTLTQRRAFALTQGSVNGVAPAGDYVVTVSTLTDGATTLLLLDELFVRAEPKVCDASQQVSRTPTPSLHCPLQPARSLSFLTSKAEVPPSTGMVEVSMSPLSQTNASSSKL